MADQESKTKQLIQLLIVHYSNMRGDENTTQSRANIHDFLEKNADMNETSNALWEIIGDEYARGTPTGNIVDYFYDRIKPKTGGKGRRSSRSNRKRRHASKGSKGSKRCTRCRQCKCRTRRGGNMFHGSNATAPVVCLAGNSKIPCTAFSAA
jgi:hypothetical protein